MPSECEATVAGSSKGRLAYILPPGKWQGMQLDTRMGFTDSSNSVRLSGGVAGAVEAGARGAKAAGALAGRGLAQAETRVASTTVTARPRCIETSIRQTWRRYK
jgi:hypothetical protein